MSRPSRPPRPEPVLLLTRALPALALLAPVVLAPGCGGDQILGEIEGSAAPDCDASYTQRVRLEVDARPYTEQLADFPVLVTLTPETFDYDGAGPSGEGLRFTLPDCEVLRHEIDAWDPAGPSRVWVNIPQLAPGAVQDIFLFFGQTMPAGGGRPNEVFNDDYVAVYHLQDDDLSDASVNRRMGANRSSTDTEGFLGQARGFESNSSIAIPDATFSMDNDPRTACMWARSDNDGNAYFWFFAYGTGSSPLGGFAMNRHGTQLECLGGDGSRSVLRGVFAGGDRSWRYVCCSYDGADATLWADGVPLLVEPQTWPIGLATGQIGSPVMPDGGGNGSWDGAIDEVRVSRVARSADWIAAEFASMTDAMVVVGPIDAI